MKSSSFYPVLVAVILFDTLQLTTSLPAQSIWLDNDQCNSISIEILKPQFAYDDGYTFLSSAIFVSGRYSLDKNIVLVGELPFALGETEYYNWWSWNEYTISETIIGNPYIGVEIRKQNLPVFGEFGIRLPLTPGDKQYATTVGTFTDYDRYEAFAPDIFALSGKGNYLLKYSQYFLYRLRLGPALWIYTKDDDTELWIDYSGQFEYRYEWATVIFGISGRFLVNESNLRYYEHGTHHLGIAASAGFGIVRPGLHFRYPIEGNELVDLVYGINLGVQLP